MARQTRTIRRQFLVTVVAVTMVIVTMAGTVMSEAQAGRAQPAAESLGPRLAGDNAPVLVQFSLDNSYPASEFPLLDAALQVLPSRSVTVTNPLAVDELLRTEFAVKQGTSDATYVRLRSEIQRRGQAVGDVVPSGTVRVPAISPYTAARNNLSAFLAVRAGRESIVDSAPTLPGSVAFGPDSLIQAQSTTYVVQATARDLASGPLRTLALSGRGQILAKQIRASLAADRSDQPAPFVLKDVPALRAALSAAQRDIYLFVLDTGWPSSEERAMSLNVLKAMCANARAWYRFPQSQLSLDATGDLPTPDEHVVNVKASLQDIEALSSHVHVVYVPMTLAQNSEPLLREIITIGLAIARWRHPDSRPEPSQGRNAYDAVAPTDVDNAIATISKAAVNGVFDANISLLRGLFYIAARAGSQTGNGYFVNMSWTTDDADILAQPVEPARGFVVAAVGNDDARDVVATPLAFAGLSALHRNVLAVMTMDDQGALACHTSRVTLLDGPDIGAVGYLGAVPSALCFSSFAAPRVAWFLAARDTLRTTDVESPSGWATDIRVRLNALRALGQPLPSSLLFNPLKYVR